MARKNIQSFLLLVGVQFFIVQSVVGLQEELGELAKKLGGLKVSLGNLASELERLKKALAPKVAKKPISAPKETRSLSLLLIDEIKKGKELVDSEKRELASRPKPILSKRESVLEDIKRGKTTLRRSESVAILPRKFEENALEEDAKRLFIEHKINNLKGKWHEEDYVHYPNFMTQAIKKGLDGGSLKILSSNAYLAADVDKKLIEAVAQFEKNKHALTMQEWEILTKEYWKTAKEQNAFKQSARDELKRQAVAAWIALGKEEKEKEKDDLVRDRERGKKLYHDRRKGIAGSDDDEDESWSDDEEGYGEAHKKSIQAKKTKKNVINLLGFSFGSGSSAPPKSGSEKSEKKDREKKKENEKEKALIRHQSLKMIGKMVESRKEKEVEKKETEPNEWD